MVAPGPITVSARAPRFRSVSGLMTALLVSLALAGSAGCDKVALTAPTGSTVVLFTNSTRLPVNGTAEVSATVIESSGTPVHNGTLVTFTTTLGTLDPPEARTRDGKATVRFHAGGRSGTAVINAFSGGAQTDADTGIEIAIGGAAANRVALSAQPGTVPAAGGTVTLLAVVIDEDGNRLPGVPVTFTASAGQLSTTTAITDDIGEARTQLTTNRQSVVRATAGSVDPVELTISVNVAPTIGITVGTANPVVNQPVNFTIAVTPAQGGAAIRRVSIDFGDGTRQDLGTGSTSASHIYRSSGTFTVTATVEDTTGERSTATAIVSVQPAIPPLVSIEATTGAAGGIFRVNIPVNFEATVMQSTTPIQRVDWSFGDGQSSSGSTTISHTYTAAGPYVVRATVVLTDGARGTGETSIVVQPPAAAPAQR
jgi:PKD repeat protein